MNFEFMPELHFKYGYPMAIGFNDWCGAYALYLFQTERLVIMEISPNCIIFRIDYRSVLFSINFTRMATLSERGLLQSHFSIYAEIYPTGYCAIT